MVVVEVVNVVTKVDFVASVVVFVTDDTVVSIVVDAVVVDLVVVAEVLGCFFFSFIK